MKPRGRRYTSWSVPAVALAVALPACSKDPIVENVRALGPAPGGVSVASGAGGASTSAPGNGAGSGATTGTAGAGTSPGAAAGNDGEGSAPVAFTKRGLRQALADCAVATYREFAEAALTLSQATEELAAAPSAGGDAARAAWRAAIASWQRAELFRFGPAARSPQPGARDLRDEIYAFPLANYCRVDQQLLDRGYAGPGFATSSSGARGLATLEYLLFHADGGNACSAALAINATGDWAAIPPDELAARRAAYAARAARDVLERANALADAWSADAGNFHGEFVEAGRVGGVFASEQQAFNAVSDALLYLEKEVKDWKLGWPLGLVPECLNAPNPCPGEVESRYARLSRDHLRQNLSAFRGVFAGCGSGAAALGFDDWLEAVGAGDVSQRLLEALAQAELEVNASTEPLEVALVTDLDSVRALHGAVKGVTDLLKTEFITVLDFELPMALEGDND